MAKVKCIGNSVVREIEHGFEIIASCTGREAAEAARRLLSGDCERSCVDFQPCSGPMYPDREESR